MTTVFVTRPVVPLVRGDSGGVPVCSADRLVQRIAELGVRCVHLHVHALRELPITAECSQAVGALMRGEIDWLVLLSPTAVRIAHGLLTSRFPAQQVPTTVHFAVQGEGTNEELSRYFLRRADVVPAVAVAEELVRDLKVYDVARGLAPSALTVLVLQAKEGRNVVAPALAEAGYTSLAHEIYETIVTMPPPEQMAAVRQCMAAERMFVFMSPSAVKATLAAFHGDFSSILQSEALCIGPTTAYAAKEAGFTCVVEATDHSESGLVSTLRTRLKSPR